LPGEVIRLPARRKTSDVMAAYDGPSPLAAMLANLKFWHELAADLHASGDPESAILSRMARVQSQKCACDAAQYVHPKLAATIASVDVEHHHYTPSAPSPISRLSDAAAQKLLDRVTSGEIDIMEAIDGLE
jgi:hypothetical protein